MFKEEATAPINIAVIKYWGKKNEQLILPTNSSISVTISQEHLKTRTSVECSASFTEDELILNGQKMLLNGRFQACLKNVKELALKHGFNKFPIEWKVHVKSENNFPTAAGLASSASGYACLVYALAKLYGVHHLHEELTKIARVGSGSACRSIYGGFVKWHEGHDEHDSVAKQIADELHWEELQVFICVVNDKQKDISSTFGMQQTVKTSQLFPHRIKEVLPKRLEAMEKAIIEKDFETFGKLTMQDSNQFHAVCLDTYPPIMYLNDVSRRIIHTISALNDKMGRIVAAYTFDAGPNAVIFSQKRDLEVVLKELDEQVGIKNLSSSTLVLGDSLCNEKLISQVIHAKAGEGAK